METTNSSSQNRKSRRNALIIASLAAVGIAGALGLGIMYGSGGSNTSEDRPQVVRPTSTAAANNDEAVALQPQFVGQVDGSGSQPQQPTDNSGSSEQPVQPTNTPEPPAPTTTPEPPVGEPTDEPEPTDTPEPSPTPDDGFECVVCDEIVELVDIWAPEFVTSGRTHCDEGTIVVVTLDEEADIWVTYTYFGNPQVSEVDHGTFGYFNLGGGPVLFPAMNIVVHAEDASGNQSSVNPGLYDCP